MKSKMTKALSLIVVMMMTVGFLVGCSGNTSSDKSASTAVETSLKD